MIRNSTRPLQKSGSALARRSGLLRAGLALLIGALCLLVAAPALANHTLVTPTGLQATAGSGSVTLQWTAQNLATTNTEVFEIQYGEHPSGSLQIVRTTWSTNANREHTISGLEGGKTYRFRVRTPSITSHRASPWTGWVTATLTASSDASLSSLSASRTTDLVTYTDLAFGPGGDVPPWPHPSDYSATAPADTAYVRLIPQAGHAGATISVGMPSFTDLQTVVSGQPSGVFKLSFAENWFSIYVSAEDGTTNHYRAMIFRKGSDANRVNLSLAGTSPGSDGISSGGSGGGANGADPPKTTSPDRGAETLTVTRSAEQTETQQQQSSGTPGPVTGLEVSVDGNKLIVSWQPPELGGPPDSYIVHIKPQGGGKGQTKRPQATKQSVTFRKLELGRTYKVWVRAKNEAGKGERTHATATLLIVK